MVEVIDVNDTPPYFVYHHYESSIEENIAIGTSVAMVSARDGDLDINNEINYSVVGGKDILMSYTVEILIRQSNAMNRETSLERTQSVMKYVQVL